MKNFGMEERDEPMFKLQSLKIGLYKKKDNMKFALMMTPKLGSVEEGTVEAGLEYKISRRTKLKGKVRTLSMMMTKIFKLNSKGLFNLACRIKFNDICKLVLSTRVRFSVFLR